MSDLEPIQRSRLGEIGQLLAKAREEKGLSLAEVSGKTLIRATILKAIEEGDDRPLPEPVYIRGFIRRFGDLVGLNGMELCDSFPWQPSGSVPLSFVSAGNIVAASPAAQETVEAVIPAIAEPNVEISNVEASKVELGQVETGQVEAGQTELGNVESGLAETPVAPVELDGADLAAAADAPLPESEGGSESSDLAVPDHEAAYDSRAALFGEDGEQSDGAAGAAAIAAQGQSATADSAAEMGGQNSVSSTVPAGSGVATLPPLPAPVMYREPEQRNFMPWILAVVAGALGLGIAALVFGGDNRPDGPAVVNDPAPVEQADGAGTAAPDASASGESTAPASTAPTAAVPADKVVLELEVRGTEAAWMDVRVDGEVQIEGNQVPGFKQRWEGNQEIDFATARPDMVWISVNGAQPQAFGQLAEARPVKVEVFKPANAQ